VHPFPSSSQVRGYGSSGESYQLSDHHGSKDPERAKNSNGLSGSNGPGPETRIYASAFRDDTHNGSDESILRQGNDDSIKTQVLCSTEVSIKYSQRGGNGM
jgi:hypothetical protein